MMFNCDKLQNVVSPMLQTLSPKSPCYKPSPSLVGGIGFPTYLKNHPSRP